MLSATADAVGAAACGSSGCHISQPNLVFVGVKINRLHLLQWDVIQTRASPYQMLHLLIMLVLLLQLVLPPPLFREAAPRCHEVMERYADVECDGLATVFWSQLGEALGLSLEVRGAWEGWEGAWEGWEDGLGG